jgi:hypothetical protein
MVDKFEWTTSDFDETSWHDCSIYGFKLEQREHGTAELDFDIDFIVEWLCRSGRECQFRVAPATLTFHNVFGLRFELDYAIVSAGMQPFTISGIEREKVHYSSEQGSFRWRLPVNWPSGLITFESPGFRQVLRRAPVLVDRQALTIERRSSTD